MHDLCGEYRAELEAPSSDNFPYSGRFVTVTEVMSWDRLAIRSRESGCAARSFSLSASPQPGPATNCSVPTIPSEPPGRLYWWRGAMPEFRVQHEESRFP